MTDQAAREKVDQILCRLCPQQYEYACTSTVSSCEKHMKVKSDLSAAGLVMLAEDQSLPELSRLGSWSTLWREGYAMCQQDMLKAGWRKVEASK